VTNRESPTYIGSANIGAGEIDVADQEVYDLSQQPTIEAIIGSPEKSVVDRSPVILTGNILDKASHDLLISKP
jgi:hypothetical protein